MSQKEELLKKLDDGYAAFKATFEGVSQDKAAQPFVDDWSLKEVLAHVAGWHIEMTGALGRMARGERPTPEGVDYSDSDDWNARFVAARGSAQYGDVLSELDESFTGFRAAVEALPEDRFEPGRTVDRIVHTSGINHYLEHVEQIREWRKSG
jgi:hypothetical protein